MNTVIQALQKEVQRSQQQPVAGRGPAPSMPTQRGTTAKAPFRVVNQSGRFLFAVQETPGSGGGYLVLVNSAGNIVVALGANHSANGELDLRNAGGAKSFEAETDESGRGYAAAATNGVYNPLGYIHGPKK